jgi:hypothetical protein
MALARYVVDALLVEGRSHREVARAHAVSKSWVGEGDPRFREGGYEALTRPGTRPSQDPARDRGGERAHPGRAHPRQSPLELRRNKFPSDEEPVRVVETLYVAEGREP